MWSCCRIYQFFQFNCVFQFIHSISVIFCARYLKYQIYKLQLGYKLQYQQQCYHHFLCCSSTFLQEGDKASCDRLSTDACDVPVLLCSPLCFRPAGWCPPSPSTAPVVSLRKKKKSRPLRAMSHDSTLFWSVELSATDQEPPPLEQNSAVKH